MILIRNQTNPILLKVKLNDDLNIFCVTGHHASANLPFRLTGR